MPTPPPCQRLGPACRALKVTLRVADLDEDDAAFHDAIGTWLIGHTEHIAFGTPYVEARQLLVDVELQVPCKHLRPASRNGTSPEGIEAAGEFHCAAHGFVGRLPAASAPPAAPRRHAADRFTVMHGGRVRAIALPPPQRPRSLPVVHHGANPCATARCRTADHTIGAACCRDLTLDIVVPLGDDETEAFLRSRQAPYLCKVKRADETIIEAEMISACGYLLEDGVHCGLHGRTRPNGEPAKPDVCYDWPDVDDEDASGHPGCVFFRRIGGSADRRIGG